MGLAADPISLLLRVLLESIIAVHGTTWRISTLRRDLVRRLHHATRLLIIVALLRLVSLQNLFAHLTQMRVGHLDQVLLLRRLLVCTHCFVPGLNHIVESFRLPLPVRTANFLRTSAWHVYYVLIVRHQLRRLSCAHADFRLWNICHVH